MDCSMPRSSILQYDDHYFELLRLVPSVEMKVYFAIEIANNFVNLVNRIIWIMFLPKI